MDPRLDQIDLYLDFAASKGMRVAHVIDTHLHADHLSGGPALAERTGAPYGLSRAAPVGFPFTPLDDGETIACGNVVTRVLLTPGHTPESLCLLVTDRTRGPEPWFVLTGDTLFVGAVGRPDLPGDADAAARQLYRSLREKLLGLPDAIEVYPAHFGGSVCGAGLSGKPMSTLGFERRFNPLLSVDSEEAFVRAATTGLPEKPPEMLEILERNRRGAAA